MGLGGFLKGALKLGGGIVTSVVPGTWDDKLFQAGMGLLEARPTGRPGSDGCPAGTVNQGGYCVPRGSSLSAPAPNLPGNFGQSFGQGMRCPDGTWDILGQCFNKPGGDVTGGGMVLNYGEAVMGRYGAALVPAQKPTVVHRCPPGAVLGNDGLCYNKRDLRKDERKWVPGRKPLLTGGDLNAISRAARAASRMKTQQKRLEKLGLLKKPSSLRRKAPSPRLLKSGDGVSIVNVE